MNFTGLSLDQAPPISAPVRFFLTAPLFAMTASLLIFFFDPTLLMSRFSLETIVVTHLFTIGFIAMVMLGALQQMLPVLAGVRLPKASLVAALSHSLLSFGLVLMSIGLLQSTKIVIFAATLSLGLGFLILLGAIVTAMRKVSFLTPTIRGMRWAIGFAFLIVMLGMYLLSSYGTGVMGTAHLSFANMHAVLAIFGFAGILIIGVSFQVIPMFYVTPPFHENYQKYLVLAVVSVLVLWALLSFRAEEFAWIAKALLGTLFAVFGYLVVEKMNQRKRPIADITVYYWRLGGVMALLGALLWLLSSYLEADIISFVGVIIGGGFIMSVMTGMLYKIIPFLVWFHLNGMGYMNIPSMGEMVNKKRALGQFVLFVLSLAFFVSVFWLPVMMKLAAATLFVSMLLLEINLVLAYKNYSEVRKRKPDFDMSGVK
ncbi:MAG: hypothetical protein PF439_12400 [Helicobacteraceae bacterium]|jgi:hypothetical protein|nr:hypothetical protein [Helicobacteraceae bacterium]